jgi:hypothetical protein
MPSYPDATQRLTDAPAPFVDAASSCSTQASSAERR